MKKFITENLIKYLVVGALIFGFAYSCNKAYREAQAKKRVIAAAQIEKAPLKTFTAKDGRQAAKTDVITLSTSEVKALYPEVIAQAKNVLVKPRLILQSTQQGLKYSNDLTIPLHYTPVTNPDLYRIGIAPVKPDSIKTFNYTDPWTTVKGTIKTGAKGDTLKVNIQNSDTITTFLHKGDRVRPWLWILSRRKLQQTVINSNPHTKIVYQQAIKTL